MTLEPTTTSDLARMAELVTQYDDLPLGGVDASVISIAERLNAADIATLDRRHSSVVRPRHTRAFTLHPSWSFSIACLVMAEQPHVMLRVDDT